MGSSKRGVSVAEAHELVEAAVTKAIREVTWLMAVVIPELMKAPQWTAEDRAKLAAALEGVAESQKNDGRTAAATAAAALAEALQAQVRRAPPS
jgi:argininosuccinate lyase